MSACEYRRPPPKGFWTPPPTWNATTKDHTAATAMPLSERKRPPSSEKREPFHIAHKVPSGDSPYVRAKHAQLVSKDPNRAIPLFWAAINAGDRVDSALKDMAVVLKQLNRSEEAIEAIKSFRGLCPPEAQDSIDNILLELYKKLGRIEEEAELLERKLRMLEQGMVLGVRAKRVQGRHVTMTIEQEKARILGNLGWVHMQLHNYGTSEQHYRRALGLERDKNKMCNLAICLMHVGRIAEAKTLLEDVRDSSAESGCGDEPFLKSYERAVEMLDGLSDKFYAGCSFAKGMKENKPPRVANKNCYDSSHVPYSPASVGPNSAGLFTQPRGCGWPQGGGEHEEEARGAARKLLYETPKGGAVESIKGKTLDQNMIHDLHEFIKDDADCMQSGSKQSWADMAEEEEDRLQAEL